jgi:D-alanyl-lipoteichoic acid acyltransferase DltB (MBOAT superfamily)
LWHGASWNFVIWGFLHGLFQLIGLMINRKFPSLAADQTKSFFGVAIYRLLTFVLVNFAWVFFRLVHFSEIKQYFTQLYVNVPSTGGMRMHANEILFSCLLIMGLYLWDLKGLALRNLPSKYFFLLMPFLVFFIYFFGVFSLKQFIYFQF